MMKRSVLKPPPLSCLYIPLRCNVWRETVTSLVLSQVALGSSLKLTLLRTFAHNTPRG